MTVNDINVLREKCQFWRNETIEKQTHINEVLGRLREKEVELQKQSDLCTMYEHILDSREDTLKQYGKICEEGDAKIADLERTIDVLAERITKLKEEND